MPEPTNAQAKGNPVYKPSDDDKIIIQEIDDQIKRDQDNRQKWEVEAYVNKNFVDGNHYIQFDKSSSSIRQVPVKRGEIRRTINFVRAKKRGVMNLIFRNDPRPHVRGGTLDATEEEIKTAYYYLKKVWKDWNLGSLIKQVVSYGMDEGLAYVFFDWDDKKGDIRIWTDDPMTCFCDAPASGNPEDCTFFTRTFRKPVAELVNSPLYREKMAGMGQIRVESRYTVSDRLNDYLEAKNGKPGEQADYTQQVIVKERAIKVYDDAGNVKIKYQTKIGDKLIRDETVDKEKYNVLCYRPEDQPGVYYTRAWISDLIDPQKTINSAFASVEAWVEYAYKVKMLARQGQKFSFRNDTHGQIIRYTGQQAPVFQSPPALPASVFTHLENAIQFMESQTIYSESQGRLSGGAESGVAIAQLQAANVNNVSEPIQNLKLFLEDLFERILEFASENYTSVRKMVYEEGDEVVWDKKIVGSNALKNNEKLLASLTSKEKMDDVVKLKPFKGIEVEIIPGDAFSDLQLRTDSKELFDAGVLPKETLLEVYKMGNTRELLHKLEQEKKQGIIDNPDVGIAEAENIKMAKGISVMPQPNEDHETHLMIHSAMLKKLQQVNNPEISNLLIGHMQATEGMMQYGMENQGAPPQPGPGAPPPPPQNVAPTE